MIQLQALGYFNYSSYVPGGTARSMLGVFVNSLSTFLPPGPQSTVTAEVSLPTNYGNYSTDIPEDFAIPFDGTAAIQIPEGATAILFSPNDSHFDDNSDIGNYGVDIMVTIKSFDLSVSIPDVSQSSTPPSPSDGLPRVPSATPVQINIPVGGSGFTSPETRGTTVTFQAGSDPIQSQTVSLADIQSGNVSAVTFNVTFDPILAGTTQTLRATISPENPFNEANFQNNSTTLQVKVEPKLKLVAKLLDNTPVSDEPLTVKIAPSIYSMPPFRGGSKWTQEKLQNVKILISCEDPSKKQAVEGCSISGSLSDGPESGGHSHDARPSWATGQLTPVLTTGSVPVPVSGLNVNFESPEASGDIDLKIYGTDPAGQTLDPLNIRFSVQIEKELDQLPVTLFYRLTGQKSAHPANHYGTYLTMANIIGLANDFYDLMDATLGINDMSLSHGGLFDIAGDWSPTPNGHRSHRKGTSVDIDRCAASVIPNNPNSGGSRCNREQVEVNKVTFRELCKRNHGTVVVEPTHHCEFFE